MARRTKPLTNTEVERAKIKTTDQKLTDGQGLFLLVKANGSKLWRFNYYKPFTNPPKRTEISLGKYPDVSLAQARKVRDEHLTLLAQNVDPQIHRKALIDEEIFKRENTLRLVAEQWREKKKPEVQTKTMEKNWARLENHLFRTLGDTPISAITPQMVSRAVEPLKERGVGDTLHRVIRLLNEVLNFAVNKGWIEFNKCVNVSASFAVHSSENTPTIRPERLPEFLSDLNNGNNSAQVKMLIKWQLLTMVRAKEAVSAEWNEIDFDKNVMVQSLATF